ncbi:ecotin family protein [Cyanobium sp. ATX 6E8]|nr:ecotin family protein [Cyanobium sp. ATX 6E8]
MGMLWGRAATLAAAAAALPLALAVTPASAIPRLDLKPYPAPAPGESRWVIQLPGVLRPSSDPVISPNPADWRVELIVGRELEVDCNRQLLRGRIRYESLPGRGYRVYRVSGGDLSASTRMACPPDQPKRRAFVPLAGQPTVVPYNASLPIVIYTPKDLQVRWRLWKAETRQEQAVKR